MALARNPIVLPEPLAKTKACAKCGGSQWTGRNVQGVVTFTCSNKKCRFKWQGGLPQQPQDPIVPSPPESEPLVKFVSNPRVEGGVEEIRRRPDLRTDFRTGALIPNDEE